MNYEELKEFVYSAPFDVMTEVYRNNDVVLSVYRPSKLKDQFLDYDVNKNLQIYMQEGDTKPFKPTHLRVFIDLKLRVMQQPALKEPLLKAFDKIFYGMDPEKAIKPIKRYKFKVFLNSIDMIAHLAQLMILEQNEGFGKTSKYNPMSLYVQGWIRAFLNEPRSLDYIIKRVTYRRNPPPAEKYTNKDNKKHKKYDPKAKPLWYL